MRRFILFACLILFTPYGQAQALKKLKPTSPVDDDLMSTKNLLQLNAGLNAHFGLEKAMFYSRGQGSMGKWVVGYEQKLFRKNLSEHSWGIKTDARLFELNAADIESRVLLMHGRKLNDYIKMTTNWGVGYGSGFNPTYMMGLTFDLSRQWYIVPPRVHLKPTGKKGDRKEH